MVRALGSCSERSHVRIPAGAAGEFSSPWSLSVLTLVKRPWSFCQKCGWQVTAKHAYTLHIRLCMKWYGVRRTHWDGSSFMLIVRNALYKAIHSCRSAVSQLKSGEWRYIKVINNKPVTSLFICRRPVWKKSFVHRGQTEQEANEWWLVLTVSFLPWASCITPKEAQLEVRKHSVKLWTCTFAYGYLFNRWFPEVKGHTI